MLNRVVESIKVGGGDGSGKVDDAKGKSFLFTAAPDGSRTVEGDFG